MFLCGKPEAIAIAPKVISLVDLSMREITDKDADPDIPILKQATAEYAKLQ
jgi:hypothetical protein